MNSTLKNTLTHLPNEIVDLIIEEYIEIESRFSRNDWGPAELNGARFAEAVYRYLEWRSTGNYTDVGVQLNRSQIHNNVSQDTSLPDGLRFHILKSMDILFDIRNKRDVAHIGNDINVNEMDARLVMRISSWTLSEIIRIESNLSSIQIQNLINALSIKRIPLVEVINGDIVILDSKMSADIKALIALYHEYPNPIDKDGLFDIVGYSSKSMFNSYVLEKLSKNKLIHLNSAKIYLTEKGVAWIEKKVDMKLKIS